MIDLWRCSNCKQLWPQPDMAERCCVCEGCGKTKASREAGSRRCSECFTVHLLEIDRKQLEEATELTNYTGPVCIGDKYWESLEKMLDGLDPNEVPDFVHTCDINHYNLDVGTIIEELHEQAGLEDSQSLGGIAELAAAVDKFNETNADVVWWSLDHSTKVSTRINKAGIGGVS